MIGLMPAELALGIAIGIAFLSAAAWRLRDKERATAVASFYLQHPYRTSGAMSLFAVILLLAVTRSAGAWERPGVGLPFLLALSVGVCLTTWLGGGFLLTATIERARRDASGAASNGAQGLSSTSDRRLRPAMVAAAVLAFAASIATIATTLDRHVGGSTDADSELRHLVAIDPPPGFHELDSGDPDVGFMDLDLAARALSEDVTAAQQELMERGFSSGWSRHFVRHRITDDSLVIRSFVFDSPEGAHEFAVPDSCCGKGEGTPSTVPGIEDALIRSLYRPETEPTGNHIGLPYRLIGIGRRCTQVVSVFFRSTEARHTYEEVEDLLAQVLGASDSDC